QLTQLKEALLKRADKLGVQICWEPLAENRVRVSATLGKPSDGEYVRNALSGRGGHLEFRLVHPQSDELVREHLAPPDYQVLQQRTRGRDGRQVTEELVVKKRPEMTGGVKSATVVRGGLGEPQIQFLLDTEAAGRFARITGDHVGERLA